ncbi:hypothetical protein EVAR_49375_1 [Eumeta japonica]|uniref:Uncharacterized protein n=1 Tax=Eumeta variegata TaxID=151549 RepID=A0A4C1XWF1_EUMVA|nr:hypothetical protein EVAR_49375_1 [Eumeta japonica]
MLGSHPINSVSPQGFVLFSGLHVSDIPKICNNHRSSSGGRALRKAQHLVRGHCGLTLERSGRPARDRSCPIAPPPTVQLHNSLLPYRTPRSLYHMRLVWRAIGGAEEGALGGGALRLLEAACATALHYADLVHGALADQGYYENHGQSKTTEEICTIVNNLEYVRRSLAEYDDENIFWAGRENDHISLAAPAPRRARAAAGRRRSYLSTRRLVRRTGREMRGDRTRERIERIRLGPIGANDDNARQLVRGALGTLEARAVRAAAPLAARARPPLRKAVFHLAWSPDTLPTAERRSAPADGVSFGGRPARGRYPTPETRSTARFA